MITQKQIKELTNIIVQKTNATAVYLFGSYALNQQNLNSDLDILVIVNDDLKKSLRREIITKLALATATPKLFFSKDFKLYSHSEFLKLESDKGSFLYHILKDAKLLYAR